MSNILDRIVGRAEGLQTKYRNALDKIDLEVAHLGDVKARDYTAAKITGGGLTEVIEGDTVPFTTVESRGNAALKMVTDKEYLISLVQAADKALLLAHEEADRILGRRSVEVVRCSATARDGAIEWSDPNCWEAASRGPLCDKCSKREYRWRTSRGMAPRSDGVFSGDAA